MTVWLKGNDQQLRLLVIPPLKTVARCKSAFSSERVKVTGREKTRPGQRLQKTIPWRIHGAAIYGAPWIPSIYPSHVSIYTSTMDPMGMERSTMLSSWVNPLFLWSFSIGNCNKLPEGAVKDACFTMEKPRHILQSHWLQSLIRWFFSPPSHRYKIYQSGSCMFPKRTLWTQGFPWKMP